MLKAALFVLKAFCKDSVNSSILLRTDNTTVAYINQKGGVKPEVHAIVRELWTWCLLNNNYDIVSFLPGLYNKEADFQSRIDREFEYKLDVHVFHKIMECLGPCEIDLFASRLHF